MIISYKIEVWDRNFKRYILWWLGNSLERAEIMMNKPYAKYSTRRLTKITEEILYIERADKYV